MGAKANAVTAGSRDYYDDLSAFDVTVLAPERTLAEKLAHLHHRASTRDLWGLVAGARHLYDVFQILQDAETVATLRPGVMEDLMVDVDERSRKAGWPFTPRPPAGFAASAAFSPDAEISAALRSGYEDIAPMFWGERPSFDAMVTFILDRADLL
jgi:hypothetical protein